MKLVVWKICSLKDYKKKTKDCDKCQQLENRVALMESSHDALEQYGRRNDLVISGIPDSVKNSDLESTVTSFL